MGKKMKAQINQEIAALKKRIDLLYREREAIERIRDDQGEIKRLKKAREQR